MMDKRVVEYGLVVGNEYNQIRQNQWEDPKVF
jgi:hypothetical protein